MSWSESNTRSPTGLNSPISPCLPEWSPWGTVRQTPHELIPDDNIDFFNAAHNIENHNRLTVFCHHLHHHLPPAVRLLFLPCQTCPECQVLKIGFHWRSWSRRLSRYLFSLHLLGPSHHLHERRMKAGYSLLFAGRGSPKLCFHTLKPITHTNTSKFLEKKSSWYWNHYNHSAHIIILLLPLLSSLYVRHL